MLIKKLNLKKSLKKAVRVAVSVGVGLTAALEILTQPQYDESVPVTVGISALIAGITFAIDAWKHQ